MAQKKWFITGISTGLGKALADEVMEAGDFVIGTLRTQEQVDDFNKTHKDSAYAIRLDVTRAEDIRNATGVVLEKFTRIDVLVNNAGIGFVGAIEETSSEETRAVFDANFFGALELTKAFLPMFRQQKSGHILQISSHGGIKAFAGFGIYNASKFALEGFSEALAQEIQPLGIKLTLVEPGPFRTNFAGTGLGLAKAIINDYSATAGVFRERIKSIDGKQEGDPRKAARAIIQIARSANPPLRLVLGKIAIGTITSKIESLQNDLNLHRDLAASVVY
ncbi:MAG: SDR family NAD(P)-dependent oxidoreductase [Bacteroidetes bacterium]|nr:SDR family NAD(P)-dependent oxidoreductase [Fibrella sp.]